MSDHSGVKCSIYAIRCKANGRVYIGRTKNVQNRVRQHFSELRNRKKRQSIKCVWQSSNFQKDYDEFGAEYFEVYVLEENLQYDESKDREQHWIDEYRSTDPIYGYNRITCNKKTDAPTEFKRGLPPKLEVAE